MKETDSLQIVKALYRRIIALQQEGNLAAASLALSEMRSYQLRLVQKPPTKA